MTTLAERRPGHPSLRHELAHAYADAYGKTCRHDTLTALESIVAWLRRCERNDGITVLRSVPQAVRGIEGWEPTGRKKLDHSRFRNSLTRRLDMLIELGVVEWWDSDYKANGMGRGILVRLRRDSSVGGAHLAPAGSRRPPRRPGPPSPPVTDEGPRRRPSRSTRVSPPLREKDPRNGYKLCHVVEERQSRGARARRRVRGHAQITRHLARHLSEVTEETGSEVVAAAPWIVDVPPSILLRSAVRAFAPRPGSGWAKHWSTLLSEQSRRQAEHAVELLDRYDGRGAGAAAIIDLAAGGWRIHRPAGRPPRFPEPRTPGLLVRGLRKRARMARDVARYRADYAAALAGSTV